MPKKDYDASNAVRSTKALNQDRTASLKNYRGKVLKMSDHELYNELIMTRLRKDTDHFKIVATEYRSRFHKYEKR